MLVTNRTSGIEATNGLLLERWSRWVGIFFFFPHTRMHKAAIFQAAHLRPTSTFLGAPPNHYGIVMYTIDPEKQL